MVPVATGQAVGGKGREEDAQEAEEAEDLTNFPVRSNTPHLFPVSIIITIINNGSVAAISPEFDAASIAPSPPAPAEPKEESGSSTPLGRVFRHSLHVGNYARVRVAAPSTLAAFLCVPGAPLRVAYPPTSTRHNKQIPFTRRMTQEN